MSAFARVCLCSGTYSESLKSAFVCVCAHVFAFVCVCKHPLLLQALCGTLTWAGANLTSRHHKLKDPSSWAIRRNRGISVATPEGCTRRGGRTLRKDVFLPSWHLLRAFYKTRPSKNPSKNLVFTANPYRLLLKTVLRSLYC